MMRYLMCAALLSGGLVFAKTPAKKATDEEHRKASGQFVYVHKKHINTRRVRERFPHAQVVGTADRMVAKRQGVLSPHLQREFFLRSGLTKHTSDYDPISKDLLVLRLQSRSLNELEKIYRKIPQSVLKMAKLNLPEYLKKESR